jgi:hypothetical protein
MARAREEMKSCKLRAIVAICAWWLKRRTRLPLPLASRPGLSNLVDTLHVYRQYECQSKSMRATARMWVQQLSSVRMCKQWGSCREQANTVGVAVTRKPTSTPCDHVKHPERLGVRGDDAGEAMVAQRSWAWVFVVRTHDPVRGRRLGCGGSSASPRLLLLPDHRSCYYCVVAVFLVENICASIRPSKHAA